MKTRKESKPTFEQFSLTMQTYINGKEHIYTNENLTKMYNLFIERFTTNRVSMLYLVELYDEVMEVAK